VGWSLLAPLLQLLVMSLVFSRIFGDEIAHYPIYLFCGNLVFAYFKESTNNGMHALMANSKIFTKVNVPKYMFLLSKNVSSFINFALTLVIFFLFALIDGVEFGWHFFSLIYPITCLLVFNIGMGLILSALFVFFRDISYLYDVFTMLLMYMSAIFYSISRFPEWMQNIFMCNPLYVYIKYFRIVVIDGIMPSMEYHLLCVFYALLVMTIGSIIYVKYNHKFLYYV
jgi:ABC-2 type transport system permease protein